MSKPSLAEALKPHDRTPAPSAVVEPPATQNAPKTTVAPSRVGKKALISYHDPAVTKQLQQMKLDLDRESVQSLIEEALNDLFQKYRRPTIA
jgi:hypothetical protein